METVRVRRDFPRPVRTVEHAWIELPDGCRLAARMWLPEDAEGDPVPAVLDAVPYRKGDGTAARDATRYPYIAGHGYACVRLDLRGSGDSDGLIPDEYTEQEQEDVEAVIAWLAAQPWCDGAVGMIGVSWGGFAALQAAARNPPALRGIVAIHSSDDRYADDVHYIGGCVLASDMVHWSACMAAYAGQPPDPAVVGEGWRDAWRERVEAMEPWVATWLAHQRRDDYWRQGSACERYDAIECPVFAVGGWVDGYRDSVLRLAEHVRGPVRALIGPWGHTWPERGAPGPAIGFLQEVVRFFDCALKGEANGFLDGPRLVAWLGDRWVAEPAWPSPNVATRELALEGERSGRSLALTGLDGGVWCGDGGPADAPLDQRRDDAGSLCWDFEPLGETLELLGHAAAVLRVSADRPLAFAVARLCAVAPDGSSSLIARGVLNLTHRDGHDRVVPLVPGEPVTVRVPMQSNGYVVPAGHALRLAVSADYWPWVWPSPEPVTLTVSGGTLELPVRSGGDGDPPRFEGAGVRAAARGGRDRHRSDRPPGDARPRDGRRRPALRLDRRPLAADGERDRALRAQRGRLPARRGRPAVGVGELRGRRRAQPRRLADARRGPQRDDLRPRALPGHDRARRLRGRRAGVRAPLGARDTRGTADDDEPVVVVRRPGGRARSSTSGSSGAPGSTPAGATSCPRPAASPRPTSPACRSCSRATATTSCARSRTSAATAARSSPPAPASAARCSARTTRGRTGSTGGCAARRARSPASSRAAPASRRWPSARGARSCSSTPTRRRRRSRTALGDLPEIVAERGLDVDALRFHHRVEYEIRANWKIALENYLECYHCRLNHPGLVSVIDDRRLTLEARGLRASQFNPAHPDFDVAGGLDNGQFHLLFPSLKFNVEPGPPNLSIGPVWPVAPDRCRGFLDYFFAPGASEDWIAEFLAFDDQVGAEDTALVEAAQAGAGSGLVDGGYLLAHDEQLIAHFQAWVRERLS